MIALFAACAALFALVRVGRTGSASSPGDFIPVGANYQASTLQMFATRALQQDDDGDVRIVVLPIPFASDPYSITPEERADNLAAAQNRVNQVRTACQAVVPGGVTCAVHLLDVQVRSDAENMALVGQIDATTDGIFILGGDQTVAMLVAADTPLEQAISAARARGAALGGTSAGAAVQARYMIGGYADWASARHGLERGALDLWYDEPLTSTRRGLAAGIDLAIVDQHVLERGRLGRLMQATFYKPTGQKVGVGVDWGTAVVVAQEHIITGTTGRYAAVVLDQETYAAAAGADHFGPNETLAIRNVAFHILGEGPYGYDLLTRRPIAAVTRAAAPDIRGRVFDFLNLGASGGTLFVTGDAGNDPHGAVVAAFALRAQAAPTPTLVLATGIVSAANAAAQANAWANVLIDLGVPEVVTGTFGFGDVTTDTLRARLESAGAIFITGDDQIAMAAVAADLRAAGLHTLLRERLAAGVPMLFDNAAGAAVGERISDEATPTEDNLEDQSGDSFLAGYIRTAEGLGLVMGAVFEPRVMYDYLYGRLVSHVYERPGLVAFGIERGTGLQIAPTGTTVLGRSAVWVVDGRYNTLLAEGENAAMVANWLLLDIYAPGNALPDRFSNYLPIIAD